MYGVRAEAGEVSRWFVLRDIGRVLSEMGEMGGIRGVQVSLLMTASASDR